MSGRPSVERADRGVHHLAALEVQLEPQPAPQLEVGGRLDRPRQVAGPRPRAGRRTPAPAGPRPAPSVRAARGAPRAAGAAGAGAMQGRGGRVGPEPGRRADAGSSARAQVGAIGTAVVESAAAAPPCLARTTSRPAAAPAVRASSCPPAPGAIETGRQGRGPLGSGAADDRVDEVAAPRRPSTMRPRPPARPGWPAGRAARPPRRPGTSASARSAAGEPVSSRPGAAPASPPAPGRAGRRPPRQPARRGVSLVGQGAVGDHHPVGGRAWSSAGGAAGPPCAAPAAGRCRCAGCPGPRRPPGPPAPRGWPSAGRETAARPRDRRTRR